MKLRAVATPMAMAPLYNPPATDTAEALISALMVELLLAAISTAPLLVTTLFVMVALALPLITFTASPPPPLTATPTAPAAMATAAAALLARMVADSFARMLMAPLDTPASTSVIEACTSASILFWASEIPTARPTPTTPTEAATADD